MSVKDNAGKGTGVLILESKIICRQPGRYIGWPCIARLPSGELLAVFSGDRDAHVCPFGKTQLVRSMDNGATWSQPETVNDTPLDDRDAGICAMPDGSVLVSWFTSHYEDYGHVWNVRARQWKMDVAEKIRWDDALARATPADVDAWALPPVAGADRRVGYWVRRSPDGGRTWETPRPSPCSTPHGPIALADGRLLYVGWRFSNASPDGKRRIVVADSSDQGDSWRVLKVFDFLPPYPGGAPDGHAYLGEPHVVETSSGRLVGMARYEEKPHTDERFRLWQFDSDDGGRTWTDPRPTGISGKPPHLLRLRDGRLLVTYGRRVAPFGQRACLSNDDGRTWDTDREIVLRGDAPSSDLGYPASVQLGDDSILTVYYQQERAGEKPCLMTTRWMLPD